MFLIYLQLLSWFDDTVLGSLACDGFKVIMDDSSDIMSNMTHSNIKVTYLCNGVYSLGWHGVIMCLQLLYRQHFFIFTTPKLIKIFHSSKLSGIHISSSSFYY